MNKKTAMILAVVAGVAVVGYVIYRYMQSRASSNSPTGSFGSNLNSVAPELVGGSSGPSVGPALSAPVNITLNESAPAASREPSSAFGAGPVNPANPGGPVMQAASNSTPNNPVYRQNSAATAGVTSGDFNGGGPDMRVQTRNEGDEANG